MSRELHRSRGHFLLLCIGAKTWYWLIASSFVEVSPLRYGGTELFIANLAVGIKDVGHDVVVYANGESKLPVEARWLYPQSLWPLTGDFSETLKKINHTAWAIRDAADFYDVIHVNSLHGLPPSHFCRPPFVYTIRHRHEQALSEFYSYHPDVHFVTISNFQQRLEGMPSLQTIHYGIGLSLYQLREKKQGYLTFLGPIAPFKGTHLAIEVANVEQRFTAERMAGECVQLDSQIYETASAKRVKGMAGSGGLTTTAA